MTEDTKIKVETMDAIDRQKLEPQIKLQLLMQLARVQYGRDPRSGGFAIVGRPRVILQLLLDLKVGPLHDVVRLNRPVIIGRSDADVIGWYQDVPIIVRCTTIDDKLWAIPRDKVPEDQMIDRKQAGQIRVHAHNRTLDKLREDS